MRKKTSKKKSAYIQADINTVTQKEIKDTKLDALNSGSISGMRMPHTLIINRNSLQIVSIILFKYIFDVLILNL